MPKQRRGRFIMMTAIVGGLALLASACGDGDEGAAASGLEPSDRFVHVQATELDSRRTLDEDPFPQATLDEWPEYFGEDGRGGAGGYYLFMSDDEEWRIGSYIFLPSQMTFVQGDRVTLEIFGVRGNEHEIVIEGPGLETQELTVKRGELHSVEFTVDEPGLYQMICVIHPPTQTADILVLPTGS